MRLIKPTTLLLLMAITCGTGSPQVGSNGASGGSGAPPTTEQICIFSHCKTEFGNCYKDPECQKVFECRTAAKDDLTKAFNCGNHVGAGAIVQCAADAGCFNQKDICPQILGLGPKQARFPNLVEQMTSSLWYAVLSNSKKPQNYLDFACNKLSVSGSNKTKNGVGISLSVCGKNETGGACVTPYVNLFGEGNQVGETGTIIVRLKEGAPVAHPANLYINVVAATDDLAIVSSCLASPNDIQVSKEYAAFARFKTYEKTVAKSGNRAQAEGALKYVLSAIGQDFNDFHKIDQSLCTN